jgi:hypothetical protein
MNAGQVSAGATELGRKAENSAFLDHAVRVGLVVYGVVHLVIAWIAVQLAFGSDQGSASSSGALSQLAQNPLGGVLLWVAAGGLAALVVWRVMEAAVGHREEEGKKRVFKRLGSAFKAVLYATLAWSALQVATGSGSSGGGTDSTTSKLMSMPAGQILVGLVGVGIAAYAARLIYRGLSEGFMDKLQTEGHTGKTGTAFVTFGKVGYVSKGLALLIVAGLFLWAAWTHDPQKSGGLDQALHKVLQQPFGMPMLLVLAAGIGCYGLFCFAWARHLDR